MEATIADEKLFLLAIKRKNEIYVILKEYGVLAAYDLKIEEWKIQCVLPEYYRLSKNVFFSLDEDEEALYLVTSEKPQILIYYFTSNTCEVIEFPVHGMKKNDYRTASALNYVNSFIFIPSNLDGGLLMFDRLTKRVMCYFQWGNDLRENIQELNLNFLFIRRDSACIICHTLYCLVKCEERDIIFSIDLSDMKLQNVYQLEVTGNLVGMKKERNCIWIQNKKDMGSKLICWNPKEGVIKKQTELFPDIKMRIEFFKDIMDFWCITFEDGKLIIVEPYSLYRKKIKEGTFLYFVKDGEIVYTDDNKTIKIINLYQMSIRKLYISSLFIKAISEITRKKVISEDKGHGRIGRQIFNKISDDLKYGK